VHITAFSQADERQFFVDHSNHILVSSLVPATLLLCSCKPKLSL